jgi:hypothetical protein
MSDVTREQACKQCASCYTWTNLNRSEEFCDTCLGDQRKIDGCYAALRTQLAQATALLTELPAGAEATLRSWYAEKTRADHAEQQLAQVTADRDSLRGLYYNLQAERDKQLTDVTNQLEGAKNRFERNQQGNV